MQTMRQPHTGGSSNTAGAAHWILMGSHAPNTPLPPLRMEKYSYFMHDPKKRRGVWAEGAFGGDCCSI